MTNRNSLIPTFAQLHMKPRITASYIFKMAEGPMLHKRQKGADYACDEVGSDTYVRKEGSRGKTKHGSNFYAIAHSYRESKRLPRAIKSRLTTFLKTYSQQIIYRSQAEM